MHAPRRPSSLVSILAALGAATVLALACADDGDEHDIDDQASDDCRLHPEDCEGGAGSLCHDDGDCNDALFCCEDNDNCGDGMCTADCHDDRDCPASMLCEHNLCFYACDDDRDCADGMTCEHDRTVCEYP
jgi:hypothetical protein